MDIKTAVEHFLATLFQDEVYSDCYVVEVDFKKLQEEYKSEFNSALIDYTFMEELRNVGLLYI